MTSSGLIYLICKMGLQLFLLVVCLRGFKDSEQCLMALGLMSGSCRWFCLLLPSVPVPRG